MKIVNVNEHIFYRRHWLRWRVYADFVGVNEWTGKQL